MQSGIYERGPEEISEKISNIIPVKSTGYAPEFLEEYLPGNFWKPLVEFLEKFINELCANFPDKSSFKTFERFSESISGANCGLISEGISLWIPRDTPK